MKLSKNLVALRTFSLSLLFLMPLQAKKIKRTPIGMPKVAPVIDAVNVDDGPVILNLGDKVQERRTSSVDLPNLRESENLPPKRLYAENDKGETNDAFHPANKIKILIDPGHGGKDLGAQGLNGVSEKQLCLKVSRLVRRELERFEKTHDIPFDVQLSRDTDDFISLHDRVRMANEWGADLFVSIHANSSPVPKAHGFEVYFLSPEATDEEASKLARLENQAPPTPISAQVISILSDATTQYHVAESSRLAETMFSGISRRILSSGRGVRQAPFTVLHGTNMPAVLVEMGYVTHQEESKNLSKEAYLKRIASAISSGIVDFALKRRKL